MSFIEVERSVRPGSWTMQRLHAHPHYEIYYLYQGSRQLLLANALYHMEAPSLAVIPPGAPHKTEGGPFARFNINVSPDYANPSSGRSSRPGPWVRSPSPRRSTAPCSLCWRTWSAAPLEAATAAM